MVLVFISVACTEILLSTPKVDVIETPQLTAHPIRHHHSIRLRISALSAADVDAVTQDLDNMCADVIQTHVMDASKYGEMISRLTDMQVLFSHSYPRRLYSRRRGSSVQLHLSVCLSVCLSTH